MIIIKITWWLWNQMFQYALWKHLAIKNNTELVLDISAFKTYNLHKYCLNIFGISDRIAWQKEIPRYTKLYSNHKYISFILQKVKLLLSRLNPKHILETQFDFSPAICNLWDHHYIEWYWQTEKYFASIMNIVRDTFAITIKPSINNI